MLGPVSLLYAGSPPLRLSVCAVSACVCMRAICLYICAVSLCTRAARHLSDDRARLGPPLRLYVHLCIQSVRACMRVSVSSVVYAYGYSCGATHLVLIACECVFLYLQHSLFLYFNLFHVCMAQDWMLSDFGVQLLTVYQKTCR